MELHLTYAGKGVANSDSFKEAVFTGIKIFKNRKEYKELTQNVLRAKKTVYKLI